MLPNPLDENGYLRGVLLSIHLTSNRPDNFKIFLDRLEATTNDPRRVEVTVKIDENDDAMNDLLAREVKARPFRITYISTPLSGGFYGLWQWYDELLRVSDPFAYFVIGLNDEMYFSEKGWDSRLLKYCNLYPDHIYRLRTSIHRERNYFDFWEASCAGDLTAIMTKRWLDLGGGWCPCNGPDSFQSAVAFYFGWLYRHDTFNRPYRERSVHDIQFGAYGANLDLTDTEALRRRMRGAIIAWFKLVSYPMQQEAARRAQKLHGHIWAMQNKLTDYEIRDDLKVCRITVFDRRSSAPVWQASYRISRLCIGWQNFIRKFYYPYYGGAGETYRNFTWANTKYFLAMRYEAFYRIGKAIEKASQDARNPAMSLRNVMNEKRSDQRSRLIALVYILRYLSVKIFRP